jgi:hypothetical protein
MAFVSFLSFIVGAAPGHPIVARAVEDLVNRIQNREDYYDIEGNLCSRNIRTDIWKLRSFPILVITGPCALGISINGALGRKNLVDGIGLGWLPRMNGLDAGSDDRDWGDSLILLADRYYLGELRFTDLERNLLVASSNQDMFAKNPVSHESRHSYTPSHYSKSECDVVGSERTYRDSEVANERIRFIVVLDSA